MPTASLPERLRESLALNTSADGIAADAPAQLERLVELEFDRLPLPGAGATLERWRALAEVGEHDLSLAKLYEGHTDALAILAELGAADTVEPGSTWGVWAAESPAGRATLVPVGDDRFVLDGAKCWCSGAARASHALLTAWPAGATAPQLVRLALRQPGVTVDAGAWWALGMAGSASLDVRFEGAIAWAVGPPGAYLSRPGFWQGGGGIAACWWGGARGLARTLYRALAQGRPGSRSDFRRAALGHVDVALQTSAAALREAARWIDAHPAGDASEVALRVRLAAESCVQRVLDEVGRALGAEPFCRDARFARAAADLPVFVRQSHAERDCAALGDRVAATDDPWPL